MNKKKFLPILLVAVLAVSSVGPVAEAQEGKQTILSSDRPDLIISSARELDEFAQNVCNGNTYAGKLIRVTKDIEYDGVTINNYKKPIGDGFNTECYNEFEGTFDGGGHVIRGMVRYHMLIMDDYAGGLFYGNAGTIKNVILENCSFHSEYSVGGIAVVNKGVIENCYVKGGEVYSGLTNAGSIAALNEGMIVNCCNTASVQGSDEDRKDYHYTKSIGGLVGINKGEIFNSCNQGNVQLGPQAKGDSGGIAGCQEGQMQNCYNVGFVSGSYSGGIAAAAGGIVMNCTTSLQAAAVNFHTMLGTARDNQTLDENEMCTAAFLNRLNKNRGTVWLPWEMRIDSAYPLPVQVYPVQFQSIQNGVLRISTDYAYAGQMMRVNVTPNTGYKAKIINVQTGGQNITCSGSGGTYTFVMPEAAVTIYASFTKIKTVKSVSNSKITLKKIKLSKVKSLKGRKLKVTWKAEQNADGYQMQTATDSKFIRKKKTFTIKKAKTVCKIVSRLKKGKRYYVRVRAYKKSSGKRIYGKWSTKKRSGKIKK